MSRYENTLWSNIHGKKTSGLVKLRPTFAVWVQDFFLFSYLKSSAVICSLVRELSFDIFPISILNLTTIRIKITVFYPYSSEGWLKEHKDAVSHNEKAENKRTFIYNLSLFVVLYHRQLTHSVSIGSNKSVDGSLTNTQNLLYLLIVHIGACSNDNIHDCVSCFGAVH